MIKIFLVNKQLFSSNDYINYLIVVYAFLLPLSKAGVTFAEILILIFWFANGNLIYKFNEIKQNSFIVTFFIFISYSFISIIWSNDAIFALDYIRKYWHFILIPIIYTSLKKEYIDHVISAFLAGMLISELVSYGIFFEILHFENIASTDPTPFMDHTSYSGYLVFTLFILIYKLLYSVNFRWRLFYLFYLLISMSNLFVNAGRTGQVIFFVGLILVGFLNIKNKLKAFLTMILLSITIFIGAYYLSPVFNDRMNCTINDIQKMIDEDTHEGGFSIRVGLWIVGTKNFVSSPILGTGIGDETGYSKEDINTYGLTDFVNSKGDVYTIDYHNMFIQYLVQLGVVGFLIILNLFYLLYQTKIKSKIYNDLKILFLFVFFMWSTIGFTLHINSSMIFFVLFSSIFIVLSKSEFKISKDINAL